MNCFKCGCDEKWKLNAICSEVAICDDCKDMEEEGE